MRILIFFIAFLIIGGIIFKYFGNQLDHVKDKYEAAIIINMINNAEAPAAGGKK